MVILLKDVHPSNALDPIERAELIVIEINDVQPLKELSPMDEAPLICIELRDLHPLNALFPMMSGEFIVNVVIGLFKKAESSIEETVVPAPKFID